MGGTPITRDQGGDLIAKKNGKNLLWSKKSDVLRRREFLSVLGFVANSLPQAPAS